MVVTPPSAPVTLDSKPVTGASGLLLPPVALLRPLVTLESRPVTGANGLLLLDAPPRAPVTLLRAPVSGASGPLLVPPVEPPSALVSGASGPCWCRRSSRRVRW